MELLQVITSRRTVRSYAATSVPFATVEDMVRLAGHAPSACNRRGWRCILVQSADDLDWLYRLGGSAVLRTSLQALIVCYESDTENSEWNDNIQSAAAFIAYFQLIAHEQGIGSCWICHLPPKGELAVRFAIPADFTPVAVVTFGYYKNDDRSMERSKAPKGKLLSRNRWDFAKTDCRQRISVTRKLLRKLYYLLPFRALLRRAAGRYEKKFDD